MMNSTPSTPPTSMIAVLSQYCSSSQTPVMTKAGIVKIAPATSASPTDAVVRAMFSSSTEPPRMRSAAIATTAAGKVAATVRPARMPRYALAVPSTIAIAVPSKTARKVSSGSVDASGTNGANGRDEASLVGFMAPFCTTRRGTSSVRPRPAW